jgi:hypothetical protein
VQVQTTTETRHLYTQADELSLTLTRPHSYSIHGPYIVPQNLRFLSRIPLFIEPLEELGIGRSF